MLTLTEAAAAKFKEFIEGQDTDGLAVRLSVLGRGPGGFMYDISLDKVADKPADDETVESAGLTVLVDATSKPLLEGSTVDWVETEHGAGFKIDNPNPLWTDPMALAVQKVIDEKINPGVGSHGGFVALLDVKDNKAYIKFGGGCQGCGMANVTLKDGIETAIKEAIPEIEQVLDTTDHASGDNPYYQAAKGDGPSPF